MWTWHETTGSSVKSILVVTFVDNCSWLVNLICLTNCLTLFLSDYNIFNVTFCYYSNSSVLFVLIPWYPFTSINWVLKLLLNQGTISHVEIERWGIPQKKSFLTTWLLLSLMTFHLASVVSHYIATYGIHSFSLLYLSQLSCFVFSFLFVFCFAFITNDYHFETDEKFLVDLMTR